MLAAAGQTVSYLDLKDMGPPPEPSARCVRRRPHAASACPRLISRCLSLPPPHLPPRRRYEPSASSSVAATAGESSRLKHAASHMFQSVNLVCPRPPPAAASVIDSSKVASVRDMWQVTSAPAPALPPLCLNRFMSQRRASLDVPSDATSGGAGQPPKSAAERRGSTSSSSQQLPQQLEGSDRIRFLVAALVDPTKNAAAAMELQVLPALRSAAFLFA